MNELNCGIYATSFDFPETNYSPEYSIKGIVKDAYVFNDKFDSPESLAMVFTDRAQSLGLKLSAIVHNKGQVNAGMSWFFSQYIKDIIQTSYISRPHPNVIISQYCNPIPVEFVVRKYLTGTLWRRYYDGYREFNGILLPDGLTYLSQLPDMIVTPTLKGDKSTALQRSFDFPVSKSDLIESGTLSLNKYNQIIQYSKELFEFCELYAEQFGIVLLDSMFEFGHNMSNKLLLIDEFLTGDTTRYLTKDEFAMGSKLQLKDCKYLGRELLGAYIKERSKNHLEKRVHTANKISHTSDNSILIKEKIIEQSQTQLLIPTDWHGIQNSVSKCYTDLYKDLHIPPELKKHSIYSVFDEIKQSIIQNISII
jgi:phosphoribosylaminoimidazole-succinocarboxamide synthase